MITEEQKSVKGSEIETRTVQNSTKYIHEGEKQAEKAREAKNKF